MVDGSNGETGIETAAVESVPGAGIEPEKSSGRSGGFFSKRAKGKQGGNKSAARSAGSEKRNSDAGATDVAEAAQKRGRGRPALSAAEKTDRASRKSAAKARLPKVVEPIEIPATAIEQLKVGISSVHKLLSVALASPELVLSDVEAATLAEASANVAKWYGPVAFSGKAGAWFSLATTGMLIYGPRLFDIARRQGMIRSSAGMPVQMSEAVPVAEALAI